MLRNDAHNLVVEAYGVLVDCGRVVDVRTSLAIRNCVVEPIVKGWNCQNSRSPNGRFLRHRFSPKLTNVATPNSLPKRNHVAKEAVSAAWQTKTRHGSVERGKPNNTPTTKPRPCVKTMLCDAELRTSVHLLQSVKVRHHSVCDCNQRFPL